MNMITSEILEKRLPAQRANLKQMRTELTVMDITEINGMFPAKVMQNPRFVKALDKYRANANKARLALAMFEVTAINLVKALKEAEK